MIFTCQCPIPVYFGLSSFYQCKFVKSVFILFGRFCEPETLAMIMFIQEHPFVLSGNLQSGALGASYPIPPLLTPKGDGVTFEHIARDYAATNPMMAHGNQCTKISKHGTMVGSAIQRKSGGKFNRRIRW